MEKVKSWLKHFHLEMVTLAAVGVKRNLLISSEIEPFPQQLQMIILQSLLDSHIVAFSWVENITKRTERTTKFPDCPRL